MSTLTTAEQVTLTTSVCDRCGALGVTRYVLPSGLDLVFCGHHSAAYGIKLIADLAKAVEVAR